MEDFLSLKEIEEKKNELRQERAELGNPHARELKDLEEPIDYILETEDKFFDPLHAVELFGEAIDVWNFIDESYKKSYGTDFEPLDQILDGTTFTWEQEMEETEGPLTPINEPSSDIFDKMDKAFMFYEISDLSETPVLSEEFDDWFSRLFEKGRNIALIDGAVDSYNGGKDYQDLVMDTGNYMDFLLDQQRKDLGTTLPLNRINHDRMKSMFSTEQVENPEKYKGAKVEMPKPHPQLKYTMAREFLERYEEQIEKARNEKGDNTQEQDIVEEQVTRTDTRTVVDWEMFGSDPSDEMKQLYEAGAKYQDESDLDLDAERLGKIVADMNGEDVEYEQGVKLGPLGDVKKAVDEVDDLDFKLPVGSKLHELRTLAESIDHAENYRTREEFEYTKTVKVRQND
ncbi:MAG: hypothetical protein H8Z69_05250 [Nanohaloarchaea archaeon]|nr:hypothetical protein [Candidatus Nanohaloarchaea archaeon]